VESKIDEVWTPSQFTRGAFLACGVSPERVRVLPNHACVVSNLHDRVYGVRAGRVETELRVAARGRVD